MDGIRLPSAERFLRVGLWLLLGGVLSLLPQDSESQPLEDHPVVWYEDDRRPIPRPTERDPNLLWDMFEDSVTLPIGRFFDFGRMIRRVGTALGGDHVPPASNVNSLDEVPNSSWFTNRVGLFPMTPEEAARGPGPGIGPNQDHDWIVVGAKTEGVTPGFTIRDGRGDSYLIKFDVPGYAGMNSAAAVIAARILYAAGYNVPDDNVVTFARENLRLKEGVRLKLPDGTRREMVSADLDGILDSVERQPDGRYRAIASRFLEGIPVGPFDYHERRDDDPNDRIRHEDRRELRGLRIFCAWLNHWDMKQHNSLDMYVGAEGEGYLKHHLIDFASTLGGNAVRPGPRHGFEYTLDLPAILGRTFALGFHEDAWRRVRRPAHLEEIGFFESTEFDPIEWKSLQPNSAFANLTDRDGYWAAKVISAFSDQHLERIVAEGKYRDSAAAAYMLRTLAERRDRIARCFFDRVAPLEYFQVREGQLYFRDLGSERGLYPGSHPRYRVRWTVMDKERHAPHWSDWKLLPTTEVEIDSESLLTQTNEEYPYMGVECQVDRGQGWSRSVFCYLSGETGSTVAVER